MPIMKIRPRLIAALLATAFIPHWQALGADFGGDEPRLSKRAAERLYEYWRFRAAVDACEAGRTFETVGDENSDFDPAIGCSTRANLTAMLSRRRDLVRGRGARYHDAERASNVVGQYRAWKAPGSTGQATHP
jgi:type IV pilus biogenesis protein CpaD/CtpE